MMSSSSCCTIFLTLSLLVTAGFGNSSECLSAETTYALCRVNETIPVVVSNNFTGDELIGECHSHFIEETFDSSCPEVTTVTEEPDKNHPSDAKRYGFGFLAVFVVSILSLIGILAVPCIKKSIFPYVLALFTALAVGTLFGDAMFHLIPFAFGLHGHGSENNQNDGHEHRATEDGHSETVPLYQWRAFVAVMILYGFYLLEVLLNWLTNRHADKNSVHHQPHGHSHAMAFGRTKPNGRMKNDLSVISNENMELHQHASNGNHEHSYKELDPSLTCIDRNCTDHEGFNGQWSNRLVNSPSTNENTEEQSKFPRATGWMVIIGDAIHNFADGLAIGAAFSEDLMIGLTTTIAIGCHELPHELGDYAVLLQAGFSRCRALMWNFISATTAVIGFFVGTAVSTNENARQWIFAVTIGMFLYIALVDLLPTLLPHGKVELRRFLCVNVGFLIGVLIMFILAIYEDKLIHSAE